MTNDIRDRAINKAGQSSCIHKVSAIGLDKNGQYVDSAINKRRFFKHGGGIHAEIELIRKCGPRLKTIILCRVNESGECLPIDPCIHCQKVIDKLGIKVVTLERE